MKDSESPLLEISLDHPHLRVDEDALAALLLSVARDENCRVVSLSIVLTDHQTVRELNRRYLEHDYDTDVLSFNLQDEGSEGSIEGEIYIDLDTAAERRAEFGVTAQAEAFRYAVHGLLHLIGYQDITPAGKAEMRRLEDFYLSR